MHLPFQGEGMLCIPFSQGVALGYVQLGFQPESSPLLATSGIVMCCGQLSFLPDRKCNIRVVSLSLEVFLLSGSTRGRVDYCGFFLLVTKRGVEPRLVYGVPRRNADAVYSAAPTFTMP